jgi:hypothetical protein
VAVVVETLVMIIFFAPFLLFMPEDGNWPTYVTDFCTSP